MSEIRALRAEVAELREELSRLRLEVSTLQRALLERDSDSEQSFSVVTAPHEATRAPASGYSTAAGSGGPTASASLVWSERLLIAADIGKYLERADRGDHRGESGRSRIPAGSRFWIVIRDFEGKRFNPVRVFSRWSGAQAIVKRGSEVGQSLFVGLPSRKEVHFALLSGGFRWEGVIEQ